MKPHTLLNHTRKGNMCFYEIPLEEPQNVKELDEKTVLVNTQEVEYKLSSPYCKVTKGPQGRSIKVDTVKKMERIVTPIVNTWRKKLEYFGKMPTHYYTVEWVYKKFPITLEWDEKTHSLLVNNYFGSKTSFRIYLMKELEFVSQKETVLVFKSKNDIKAGSEINIFKNVRNFVNRKLDRRIFEDGVLITKTVK